MDDIADDASELEDLLNDLGSTLNDLDDDFFNDLDIESILSDDESTPQIKSDEPKSTKPGKLRNVLEVVNDVQ